MLLADLGGPLQLSVTNSSWPGWCLPWPPGSRVWQIGLLSNDQMRNQQRGTARGMVRFIAELENRLPAETVSAMRAAAGAWPRCQSIETVIQLLDLFLS